MLAACEPYIKRVYTLQEETCKGTARKIDKIHPLERLLVNDLVDDINQNDFVLFIQYNYTKFQAERVYKNTLTKLGAKFHSQNNNVYKETFRTLNYNYLNGLFIGRNAIITGKLESLPPSLRALRKMPTLLLLAGMVDKHLYNVNQLRSISNQSDLNLCRADLLSTLNSPAQTLSSYLKEYSETIKPHDQLEKSD